jgi:hypothetical protein
MAGSENYGCSVVGRQVRITTESRALYGPGGIPLDQATQMTGCDGNATCRKFKFAQLFRGDDSFGCPCHESLKTG